MLQLFGSVTACCLHREMLAAMTICSMLTLQMLKNACALHESWLLYRLVTIALTQGLQMKALLTMDMNTFIRSEASRR